MKNFCNLVGFPIVKHEIQCLALFRLLEQECLKVIKFGGPSVLQIQGHEVSGSLRGLSLMLIKTVSRLRVGVEFLQLLWGLLVIVNDSTTTFLECKGA